ATADAQTIVNVLPIWLQPSAGANFTLNANALVISSGTVQLIGDAKSTHPDLRIEVLSGATLQVSTTQHLRGLDISDGANVLLDAGGQKGLVLGALSMSPTGRLDLKDNFLIVDYSPTEMSPIGSWSGSAYTGVTGRIDAGRNGGSWNGNGIITTDPR